MEAALLCPTIGNDRFGLTGGSPVADRDQVDLISADQLCQLCLGFVHPVLGRCRINDPGIQDFAGTVNDRQLAAGPEGGIPAKNGVAL